MARTGDFSFRSLGETAVEVRCPNGHLYAVPAATVYGPGSGEIPTRCPICGPRCYHCNDNGVLYNGGTMMWEQCPCGQQPNPAMQKNVQAVNGPKVTQVIIDEVQWLDTPPHAGWLHFEIQRVRDRAFA